MITTKDATIKAIAAMACITTLEAIALIMGIDGYLLSVAVAGLAGLGGYALSERKSEV